MKITKNQVEEALSSLEKALAEGDIVKASEDDLDQPEGGELDPAQGGEKLSDAAKAKKAKKAMSKGELKIEHESDDEDEEDEEEDEGEEMEKKYKSKAKKSFYEDMPEEIQTKIDVSEFLKSLVSHTGETIDSLSNAVAKSDKRNENRYSELVEAVEDVQKSQAKIGIVLKAICERIGVIESAPARAAKSEMVAKSGADRQFSSALAEESQEKVFKSLSENPSIAKSQMANALCELVRKGEASDMDVIGFESGGYIRPELVSKLKQVLN